MKITIHSTDQLTDIDGVPVRVWNGTTERGVACKVFVHRLAVSVSEDAEQFNQELKEQLLPGRVMSLRSIL